MGPSWTNNHSTNCKWRHLCLYELVTCWSLRSTNFQNKSYQTFAYILKWHFQTPDCLCICEVANWMMPSDVYMCQWGSPPLVKIMVWCPVGIKRLYLNRCRFIVIFHWWNDFHWRKRTWKCHLQNGHFVLALRKLVYTDVQGFMYTYVFQLVCAFTIACVSNPVFMKIGGHVGHFGWHSLNFWWATSNTS